MYYTHFADGVNHVNWKDDVAGDAFFFGGWNHPDYEPGPAVTMPRPSISSTSIRANRRLAAGVGCT